MSGSSSHHNSESRVQLVVLPPQSAPTAKLDIGSRCAIESKVNLWLDTQHTQIRFDGFGPMRPYRQAQFWMPPPDDDQNLLSAPVGDRKKVRWTPSVKDNEKAPKKSKGKAKNSKTRRNFSSSPKNLSVPPPAPNPPMSRGPPPTPRPRRVPTPDLPELKQIGLCPCCDVFPYNKMDAQMKAAKQHIASRAPARHPGPPVTAWLLSDSDCQSA